MVLEIRDKRQFLYLMGFPEGSAVCNALNLPPLSQDVDELEMAAAFATMTEVVNQFDTGEGLLQCAEWICEVITHGQTITDEQQIVLRDTVYAGIVAVLGTLMRKNIVKGVAQ